MSTSIKDLPDEERPREKLLTLGAKALSNVELLAILLHSGTRKKSVFELSQEILAKYKEDGLASLVNSSPKELISIKGLGLAKVTTLLAAIELGLRLAKKPSAQKLAIKRPLDVVNYVMPRLRYEKKEHFAILLLDTKNQIIAFPDISIGSLNASIVHPREVFRCAINHFASSMILVHNHPSGDPSPSMEDMETAYRILKGKKIADGVRCIVIPATMQIMRDCVEKGIVTALIDAGAVVSTPTCGPCLGGYMGILAAGERCVATTNRNFVGRMGHVDSEIYLASPATAAASALTGYITAPQEGQV